MSVIWKTYQKILVKFPISTQAVQTGFLMGTGDLIAQILVEKKAPSRIDLVRTGQFMAVGTLFVGPPLRIWYGVLERYFGSQGKTTALKKVATDQFIFAPVFIAVIMGVVIMAQGSSVKEMTERVQKDYTDVLVNNYKLWPAVQLINFYIVPLHYQVLTVQFVAIIWNTYLSWKMNQRLQVLSEPRM